LTRKIVVGFKFFSFVVFWFAQNIDDFVLNPSVLEAKRKAAALKQQMLEQRERELELEQKEKNSIGTKQSQTIQIKLENNDNNPLTTVVQTSSTKRTRRPYTARDDQLLMAEVLRVAKSGNKYVCVVVFAKYCYIYDLFLFYRAIGGQTMWKTIVEQGKLDSKILFRKILFVKNLSLYNYYRILEIIAKSFH
jgi:hypothetical protein